MTPRSGILGAGVSGLAAARLLNRLGGSGWCASESLPPPTVRQELSTLGFPWQASLPQDPGERVVLSPGIPVDHPWVTYCRGVGVEVVPEFELGARHLRGKILAVTGSLGKTTMVKVAEALLRKAGHRVTVSGNIGDPVCDVAHVQPDTDVHIMELSSFQLEASQVFAPEGAVCLNLYPNHLDRHGSIELYAAAKAKLFTCMESSQWAWWPENFPVNVITRATRREALTEVPEPWQGTRFAEGVLAENLQRMWGVLERWRLPAAEEVHPVLQTFQPPPHRMEPLSLVGVGEVINDSKSTCWSATHAALRTSGPGTHLIAGGRSKAEDPIALKALLKQNRVSVYLIGECAEALAAVWSGAAAHCECCGTLEQAVERLWQRRDISQPLLFSPGCASFDQFESYAQRGEVFRQLVMQRAGKKPLPPNER